MTLRSELRKEIDLIKRNYTLKDSRRLRKLKRALEALDHEEEKLKSDNAKAIEKHREKIASQNRRRVYRVSFV